MRIDQFTFGSIRIDGAIYDHDVVVDLGRVRERTKKLSTFALSTSGAFT